MTNIVMTIRDRFKLTEQAIVSLYRNSYEPFTLTIVDDQSEDFRIRKLITSLSLSTVVGSPAIVRIERSKHVLSQAKNLGVYWSQQYFGRGDWLCICDNDVYFCEGWLEKMETAARSMSASRFELWGGQSHPFHSPISEFPSKKATEHNCLAGTHWFMPYSTWDKYGPFDRTTAPGVCQSEDFAFTERIRADGGRIGVVWPHVVLDCGITNSDGKPSPGAEEKMKRRVAGVYYE